MDSSVQDICPFCHQPISQDYYFCPNCGKGLKQASLPTDINTQIKLYAFSIILPMIAFLFVTRWQGIRYFKSEDPKAKQIGQIACVLLFLSTIFTIWYSVVWTQNFVKSQVDSMNADFSSMGL